MPAPKPEPREHVCRVAPPPSKPGGTEAWRRSRALCAAGRLERFVLLTEWDGGPALAVAPPSLTTMSLDPLSDQSPQPILQISQRPGAAQLHVLQPLKLKRNQKESGRLEHSPDDCRRDADDIGDGQL